MNTDAHSIDTPPTPTVAPSAEEHAGEGRAAFITYGCRLNQYDTQAIREQVLELGYRECEAGHRERGDTDTDDPLDVIVVNSCTVTARAGEKVEGRVRSLSRRHPDATIIVTGCMTESDRTSLAAIPGVEHLVGNEEKDRIPAILAGRARAGEVKRRRHDRAIFDLGVTRFTGHTRAFVKVQDGCDSFCSYCIIPYLRGASRSRDIEDVLEEGRRVAAAGHRELVLTGIHLRQYGRDRGLEEGLVSLLRGLRSIEGIDRVRLSSIGERAFTPAFLALFAEDPGLCPSFHIPLQSGCDAVLERMGRDYTATEYLETLERIRAALPHATITTDLMVGFPGETEEEFESSLETCRASRFLHTHIFPYSVRPRTRAARLPDHVAPEVRAERMHRARIVAERSADVEREARVGSTVDLLVEKRREGELSGLSREGLRVFVGVEEIADAAVGRGSEVRARITATRKDGLTATWIATEPHRGGSVR